MYILENIDITEINSLLKNNFDIYFNISKEDDTKINNLEKIILTTDKNNNYIILNLITKKSQQISEENLIKKISLYLKEIEIYKINSGFIEIDNKKYKLNKFSIFYKKRKIYNSFINKDNEINQYIIKFISNKSYKDIGIIENVKVLNQLINIVKIKENYISAYIVLNEYNINKVNKIYEKLKNEFNKINFVFLKKDVFNGNNLYNVYYINNNKIIKYIDNNKKDIELSKTILGEKILKEIKVNFKNNIYNKLINLNKFKLEKFLLEYSLNKYLLKNINNDKEEEKKSDINIIKKFI